MPDEKVKTGAAGEDSYSAKTHLHQPVVAPETATVAATALPANAPEGALPSEVRPEIVTYEKLVEAIKASGKAYNMEMIDKAYNMANDAHKGVCRRSGEPYICHPLAVARLVLDLGMDTESIAAALLHDVVEDTPTTIEQIKSSFGEEVALLVDGVTKLTKIQFSNIEELQAENLRKMLLAMSRDVRVMIIKLCDRLHNMRTGDAWPEQKRRDKARETMEVYAPIANRLGILNVKEELEDRSLHYLDPVGYEEINKMLSERAGEEFLAGVSSVIEKRLEESGIEGATIKRRVKSIYGIYRKTIMQNKSFDEIYDIYAVRIILDTLAECYSTLGLIHDMYHPLPNRFKDYISTPKPNGYQSLHTTVIGHEGVPFEVQIRTRKMDEMAEYGVAAHWKYKEGLDGHDKLDERLAWVSQLLENQRVSEDSGNLLHDLKSDLLPEEVFAFTPKGDVINLPTGATCIDFAYAIHSAVGNRMVGCKVNNRMVPIDHIVSTGEIIEVILGPADKGPSRDWLKIVRTSEAKSKIRNWFKKMRREDMSLHNELMAMSVEQRGRLAVTMLTTGMYIADGNTSGFSMNNALSSFLQSEINNITGSALRTLDLSFGMDNATDASGNTHTDYSFKFAKRFWNNRMKIVVGGKVSTGADVANQNESFFDNVTLEYRLSNSSDTYVKLFYDNNAYDWLEGTTREYGVGFIWRRSLQHFKDIFSFKKKDAIIPLRSDTIPDKK